MDKPLLSSHHLKHLGKIESDCASRRRSFSSICVYQLHEHSTSPINPIFHLLISSSPGRYDSEWEKVPSHAGPDPAASRLKVGFRSGPAGRALRTDAATIAHFGLLNQADIG